MNYTTRNRLADLLADLRNSGRELAPELLQLHVSICAEQADETNKLAFAETKLKAVEERDPMSAGHYELHLGPSLSPRNRKRIKDTGGDYSECRGAGTIRFVTVPVGREELAVELLSAETSPRVVAIVRAGFGGEDVVLSGPWTVEKLAGSMRRVNVAGLAKLAATVRVEIALLKDRLV